MGIYIHREASFKKSLETLARGNKITSRAASRAEEILEKLASGDYQAVEIVTRQTKHGELRIEGCRKYDLGGGYRLVCVKQDGHLVATFVGSHDDCNRWIENNRRFELEFRSHCAPLFVSENQEPNNPRDSQIHGYETDQEDILSERVDEKILRRIFTGICGKP